MRLRPWGRKDLDPKDEAVALGALAEEFFERGDFERSLDLRMKALDIEVDLGDFEAIRVSTRAMGDIHVELGQPEVALEIYERGRKFCADLSVPDRAGEAEFLDAMARVFAFSLSDFQTAIAKLEEAMIILESIGDRNGRVTNLLGMSSFHGQLGDSASELKYGRMALEGAREIGARNAEAIILFGLGNTSVENGDPKQAVEFLETAAVLVEDIGTDMVLLGQILEMLSQTYFDLDDPDNALRCSEAAREMDP